MENGWVKQSWPEGDSYTGYVQDNEYVYRHLITPNIDYSHSLRIDRFGCFDWFKGDRYEGEWKDEMFHGVGSYILLDGSGADRTMTIYE